VAEIKLKATSEQLNLAGERQHQHQGSSGEHIATSVLADGDTIALSAKPTNSMLDTLDYFKHEISRLNNIMVNLGQGGGAVGQIGDLAPGQIIHIYMNGMFRPWLIWRHGAPSDDYWGYAPDDVFLLSQRAVEQWRWNNAQVPDYANSEIHARINSDAPDGFLFLFEVWLRSLLKEGKIPYRVGATGEEVGVGVNGLSTKAFLPSLTEIGVSSSTHTPIGANFGLFPTPQSRIAMNAGGANTAYITRTPHSPTATTIASVSNTGWSVNTTAMGGSTPMRDAIVLPPTVQYDASRILVPRAQTADGANGMAFMATSGDLDLNTATSRGFEFGRRGGAAP